MVLVCQVVKSYMDGVAMQTGDRRRKPVVTCHYLYGGDALVEDFMALGRGRQTEEGQQPDENAIRRFSHIGVFYQKSLPRVNDAGGLLSEWTSYFLFRAMSTVTATATVAPTIGLFPMPRNPIIST